MKVKGMDLGICGVEQLMYAGSVAFNDDGVSEGIELIDLPANVIVTRAVAVVTEAFNAATTNVLTVGTNDGVNDILGSSDITEGTVGTYSADKFVEYNEAKTIKAKYTQTGTAATKGAAEIYLFVVRTPQ